MLLPKFMLAIPDDLAICQQPEQPAEIERFMHAFVRFSDTPDKINKVAPERAEKIRSFRLLQNKKAFLEIGTFDKSNLAWLSSVLAPDALLIDLDIKANETKEKLIRDYVKSTQKYISIVGDSTSVSTRQAVIKHLNGQLLDAIFIDANHVARYVLGDFTQFSNLVKKDGYIFFHDIQWEGSDTAKGVAQAIEILQRYVPVYQCVGNDLALSHFYRPIKRGKLWGGVAIIRAADLDGMV